MKGSPGCPLAGSLFSLLLLVSTGVSGEVSPFFVRGPAEPIMALLGTEASLPCQLSPTQSAAHMDIRWYRAQPSPAVLLFQNGQEQGEEAQMPEYRGRTQLVRDVTTGSVALQIRQVRASDDGQYHCRFTYGLTSQEASVELRVIGLGSAPLVHMTGPEKDGIRVLCSSSGWFPKPEVEWRDTAGEPLRTSSAARTRGADGLFRVEASLLVTDRAIGKVICSIRNPLYDQEKAKAILLPEPFFPQPSPWKTALASALPLLLLVLGGVGVAGWREHLGKKREMRGRAEELEEVTRTKKEMQIALKIRDDLQADLDQRKALYREDWKKALLYPDWRKELFQPAPVRINHETDGRNKSDPRAEHGREEAPGPSLGDPLVDHNLITLYQEGFMLGRYYWEVDVGDTEEWTLGVYESYTQDASPQESLRKFRVLEKNANGYRALTFCSQSISLEEPLLLETRPLRIAVFLDQEDNDLSFYNMTDETHIFSFSQASFLGSLYPYFRRNSVELSPSTQS